MTAAEIAIERNFGYGLGCSFCGKSPQQVKNLIVGPGVDICDECVGLCNDFLAEDKTKQEGKP